MIPVRRCLFALVVACPVALSAGVAQADTPHHTHALCVSVRARGVGQDLGNGATEATITSHGVVLGTTHAMFTPTGMTGTSLAFDGPIVFTPKVPRVGTLTAQVTGAFGLSTGAFRASSTSITGTGLLRHVTGDVSIAGNEDLTTGSFTEELTGTLCLNQGAGKRAHVPISSA
jgi:hypothetical protein